MPVELVKPSLDHLPDYKAALERGWSSDSLRGAAAAAEELDLVTGDPESFLAQCDDPDGRGPPVKAVDGTMFPRLPSIRRFIWEDGFCGSIGLRWWASGSVLPDWFVWGHTGYSVPAWKQGQGYATAALSLLKPLALERGLTWLELTTNSLNLPSQRVVAKNGGYLVAEEDGGPLHGQGTVLRWRIDLAAGRAR